MAIRFASAANSSSSAAGDAIREQHLDGDLTARAAAARTGNVGEPARPERLDVAGSRGRSGGGRRGAKTSRQVLEDDLDTVAQIDDVAREDDRLLTGMKPHGIGIGTGQRRAVGRVEVDNDDPCRPLDGFRDDCARCPAAGCPQRSRWGRFAPLDARRARTSPDDHGSVERHNLPGGDLHPTGRRRAPSSGCRQKLKPAVFEPRSSATEIVAPS